MPEKISAYLYKAEGIQLTPKTFCGHHHECVNWYDLPINFTYCFLIWLNMTDDACLAKIAYFVDAPNLAVEVHRFLQFLFFFSWFVTSLIDFRHRLTIWFKLNATSQTFFTQNKRSIASYLYNQGQVYKECIEINMFVGTLLLIGQEE